MAAYIGSLTLEFFKACSYLSLSSERHSYFSSIDWLGHAKFNAPYMLPNKGLMQQCDEFGILS